MPQHISRVGFAENVHSKLLGISKLGSLFMLEYNWSKIVGKLLSTHSNPKKLKDQQLTVVVDHPIFAQQIEMYKLEILKKIFRLLELRIHKIFVQHKKIIKYQDNAIYEAQRSQKNYTLHTNHENLSRLHALLEGLN